MASFRIMIFLATQLNRNLGPILNQRGQLLYDGGRGRLFCRPSHLINIRTREWPTINPLASCQPKLWKVRAMMAP